MDAVADERGQALVIAVLLLAIAAMAIGGLRMSQDRILAHARERRAGEAAAEAATAVIADAYAAELQRVADSRASPRPTPDVRGAVTEARTRESARVVASDISARNGGEAVSDVVVRCEGRSVEVSVTLAGAAYRAGFAADQCSQP